MSTPDKMYVNVKLPLDLVRRLDAFVARVQQRRGPLRRVTRSDAVRSLLDEHLPAMEPRPVRTRVRKPAS